MPSTQKTVSAAKVEEMAVRAIITAKRRQDEAAEAFRRAFNARKAYETGSQATFCPLSIAKAYLITEAEFDKACARYDQAVLSFERIQ